MISNPIFDPAFDVIDACIGTKWLLDESYSLEARALLTNGATLVVPDLFHAEVANILWKHTLFSDPARRIDPADTDSLMRVLLRYPLRVEPTHDRILMALALSNEISCAVYDAIYIALAREYRCRCITADEVLIRRIRDTRIEPWVHFVGDL